MMSKHPRAPRRRSLRLERLEPRRLLAGDTYLVNFQSDEATTPTRYLRDTGDVFGERGGGFSYGWSSDHVDQARERSAVADQRFDTLIHVEAGQSWEFALANGQYEVTVAVGDPANDDGVHTVNVEDVNYWSAVPDGGAPQVMTLEVTVSDGRLTIDSGAAAEKATRLNYVHIVGVPDGPNEAPAPPTITEPAIDGQEVNPADVHMEAVGFSDDDGDAHKSTDWEIWTVGPSAEPVWQTLGIEGVERLHTHFGDGLFLNSRAGETELAANTDYELRARFRDDAGAVSGYSTRAFRTGDASTTFALELEDIVASPAPEWTTTTGAPIDLPVGPTILSPADAILAIDLDVTTDSESPIGEQAENVLDGDPETKYLNFGELNTGFIVTPSAPAAVRSFSLTTANDAEDRDPASWALYGTNDPITTTPHGAGRAEDWTLIDAGDLSLPSNRLTASDPVGFANATSYASYKLIFPTVKDAESANSMQIADVRLFGSTDGSGPNVLSPDDAIVPIQDADAAPSSESPPGEGPAGAIDLDVNTKYLNYGEERSGFIVTPSAGATTLTGFRITTANDIPERDPTSWILYGTNDEIVTPNHGVGDAENWTLIDSGQLSLPLDRFTPGADVAVDNQAGAFTSYRMVFPTVRDAGAANSMQFSEVQFFGEQQGGETAASLRVERGDTGEPLLRIDASDQPGNLVTHYPRLSDHSETRVVLTAGSQQLVLGQSDLTFEDETGITRTIFMPAVSLAPGERLDLWVSSIGATYFGDAAQTEPDFSNLARAPALDIPFVATQAGFVVEEVGSDYRLPVNIAFVPNPGPNPDDPLYYVTELYGSIQVVTRDGMKHEFATGLLDYNPEGPISGSGEQGLTGLTVQRDETNPDVYHLYVGMLWDNGDPPGGASHYPKVERIDSAPGGLSIDTRTVLLNMQPETQGQSHQISNVSIGPDDKLYVHVGDGFDASTAQDLDQFRGKILRMNKDGTAPSDNPFYDLSDGLNSRDFIYASGFRNPFGGAWREADGKHYMVENGPSVDRMTQLNEGVNYGWDGSNASMFTEAIYNWNPSHAPVNIAFAQRSDFAGSQLPAELMDVAFVSESGPTYATGSQANGKRLVMFSLDDDGNVVDGPETLVEYVGMGKSTVVGLAAGPDGLYFSELYEDSGENGPTASGARIYRVRYENPLKGDYDIDGDVDADDYHLWRDAYGSTLHLAADGNGDGVVGPADFAVWRDNLGQTLEAPLATPIALAANSSSEPAAAPAESTKDEPQTSESMVQAAFAPALTAPAPAGFQTSSPDARQSVAPSEHDSLLALLTLRDTRAANTHGDAILDEAFAHTPEDQSDVDAEAPSLEAAWAIQVDRYFE